MRIIDYLFAILIFYNSINIFALTAELSKYYAVVIDAGSTGSRAFVFTVEADDNEKKHISSETCGKVRPGLSEFGSNHTGVHSYLIPVLENCKNLIPLHQQSETQLYIKGTAGMRILDDDVRSALWDTIVEQMNEDPTVPFQVSRQNCGTLSGHMEAFYAVVASNYIAGSIDANLMPTQTTAMVGAMDMGGGSNQLVIYNHEGADSKVSSDQFWSHSYLHYGVVRIRERVMDYLHSRFIEDYSHSNYPTMIYYEGANYNRSIAPPKILESTTRESRTMDNIDGKLVNVVLNPCGLTNTQDVYESDNNFIFLGTSQPEQCLRIIEEVMWPSLNSDTLSVTVDTDGTVAEVGCSNYPCPVDDIFHPEVDGQHFYAMSVYYYALDCIRQLGPASLQHWPNPSIAELKDATIQFCNLQWEDARQRFFDIGKHKYTRKYQLPFRCLESLYIVTLLEKGFGFDQDSRSITLALEIEGKEVEWTLGFVLADTKLPINLSNNQSNDYKSSKKESSKKVFQRNQDNEIDNNNPYNSSIITNIEKACSDNCITLQYSNSGIFATFIKRSIQWLIDCIPSNVKKAVNSVMRL